ncbi:hypothetical protein Asphe3_19980 [Pseudarthrobacter phenanthrenivorans Sphe3]|uniref:Uncharacterized protein n=1 Tax=Pseudarthrobacter phenanthrenivorans (strain DSM 18606 / JCM 16027 / LMG 23796 / Sphe3) TaxID=930171 RepID=F0M201_PSEPM|nr:hypothetical protein Asphe3_19980 [Pseudarthrobacter phenanthrenivorans Sphe3]
MRSKITTWAPSGMFRGNAVMVTLRRLTGTKLP